MLPIQILKSGNILSLASCCIQKFYSSLTLCFAYRPRRATLETGCPVSQLAANGSISTLWFKTGLKAELQTGNEHF